MAYTPLSMIIEHLEQETVHNEVDTPIQRMRVIGLNNGREVKCYLAPQAGDKITVSEILDFTQIQADNMRTTSWPLDYCAGYSDAIEAIYLYIKKRIEEDSKKKIEVDANCC